MKNIYKIQCEDQLQDWIIEHSNEIPCSFPNSSRSFLGKEFPEVHAREYFPYGYSHLGKGDLVLKNGQQKRFLVVETKYLTPCSGKTARRKRTEHRKKVKEQAIKYAKDLQKRYPDADIYYASVTNSSLLIKINRLDNASKCS